jgi:SSS family solute:Na+ symporter
VGRLAVAAWLLPGYFTGQQETAYARLETRFGTPTRRLASIIFLLTRAMGDGVRIYASAIPLAVLAGWDIPASILVMSAVTLLYTWHGGLKAVVWVDVVQLVIYLVGGMVALSIATGLAGGWETMSSTADAAGHLRLIDLSLDLTRPYTLLGGLIGGAMLSAASHGTDQLIVQRLLASRGLRQARFALVGSGILVIGQFALFLLIGVALVTAGQAPPDLPADQLFSSFIVKQMPVGLAGLMLAAIMAAAMSTQASAINALASSVTHDLYSSWTGRRDAVHLFRVGRVASLVWGGLVTGVALAFDAAAGGGQTPVVVFALSIASVTYGALLGAYLLAGGSARVGGRDVISGIAIGLVCMLMVFFGKSLAAAGGPSWLATVGRLAWPWYVPLGTLVTVAGGCLSSLRPRGGSRA